MPKPAVGKGRLGGLMELAVVVVEEKDAALLRRDLRRDRHGGFSGVGMGLRGEGGCGDVWVWVWVWVWACSQSWRTAEARSK